MTDIGAALGKLVAITRNRDPRMLDDSFREALRALIEPGRSQLIHARQRSGNWIWDKNKRREEDSACRCAWQPHIDEVFLSRYAQKLPFRSIDPATTTRLLVLPLQSSARSMRCLLVEHDDTARQTLIEHAHALYYNYLTLLQECQTDTLTGLLNRKTLDICIDRLITARATACVAVLDIDHFKKINDHFGHVYGDEVLILMSRLMESSFRSRDMLFRFGGEEFVVVLDRCTMDSAIDTLNRFRLRLENTLFPQVGRVTASFGVTAMTPQSLSSSLVHQADQALYFAKQNGRNRVCCYEHLVQEGSLKELTATNEAVLF